MFHYVTDALNGAKVAINSDLVVAVFIVPDGEHQGKTSINLSNGNILVQESDIELVALFNGS